MKFVFHKPYPVASNDNLQTIPEQWVREPGKIYAAQKTVVKPLIQMFKVAEQVGVSLVVLSSHRTFEEQSVLFVDAEKRHGKGKGILWLAPTGFSEHHTGYAFDLADKNRPETDDEQSFESTSAFEWLSVHAKDFGFELSFPKNNWQGISYEPWHWRFVGDESSKELFHPRFFKQIFILSKAIGSGVAARF